MRDDNCTNTKSIYTVSPFLLSFLCDGVRIHVSLANSIVQALRGGFALDFHRRFTLFWIQFLTNSPIFADSNVFVRDLFMYFWSPFNIFFLELTKYNTQTSDGIGNGCVQWAWGGWRRERFHWGILMTIETGNRLYFEILIWMMVFCI